MTDLKLHPRILQDPKLSRDYTKISFGDSKLGKGDPGRPKLSAFCDVSQIWDPGSGIRDPGSGIRDPGSGIRDTGSGIRNPGSGISDRKSVV